MIRTIAYKLKLVALGLVVTAGLAIGSTAPAYAQGASGSARSDVCAGITAGGGTCNDNGSGLTRVIQLVVQILSVVAGVASVIMIIVGGLRYITSGGDSSKVASAKSAILYAIIGLIIVALAQVIVRFVLASATK